MQVMFLNFHFNIYTMRKSQLIKQNQILIDLLKLEKEKNENLDIANRMLKGLEKQAVEKLHHSYAMRLKDKQQQPIDGKIKSLNDLIRYIRTSPSIYVSIWGRSTACAFFLNMNIRTLENYIKNGYLYTQKPNKSC